MCSSMREKGNHGRRALLKGAGLGTVAATAGCLNAFGGAGKGEVAIGGKQFTEQLILSNISKHLLQDAGFGVETKFPVGGNTANHKALINDRVDHYWEYTGTGWNYHLGNTDEKIRDAQQLYDRVDSAYREEFDIDWLQMADFNNTYIVTANSKWQEETGVETLSGLAEYINSGNEVTWAVSQEYLNNPTAFGNLPQFYGFEKNVGNVNWEKMAIGTINYRAVANGDVDLGVGFATNPNVQKFDLATVEDDENWFVIYYPAPLVSMDVLTDEMKQLLNEPTSELDTETMQRLNKLVSIDKEDPSQVAENWLQEQGML
ncbi:glycine betaine ABC transporter substrate-binding protein [Halobium palmae]|uniref:Glycine betaine ABC transporter substrate-binding protein n=1 Tax=Halobium palmae TaxID=1776492 RepID=A0ABD5RVV6_9EURY